MAQVSGGGPWATHTTAFCDVGSGACAYPYKVNVTTGTIFNPGTGVINITTGGGSGGSGTPGGSNPQLQYNNAGAFGGVVGSGVDANGNVGLGTVNPIALFQTVGAGNVGINSTSPGQRLDVQGTVRATTYINSLTLVQSGTVSASSTFTISNLSPSVNYFFLFNYLQNTSNGNLEFRFNADSGANYYFNFISGDSGGGFLQGAGGGQTFIQANTTHGSGKYSQVRLDFQTVPGTNTSVQTIMYGSFYYLGVPNYSPFLTTGFYTGASNLTSMTVLPSAGSMTGNWWLYAYN